MRSPEEKTIERTSASSGKRRKPKFKGGKALLRLMQFYAEREPLLNTEMLASTHVPKSAAPRWALPKRKKSGPARRPAEMRARKTPGKTFAKAYAKAIAGPPSRLRRVARAAQPAAVARWVSLGPSRIPDGQTYGASRIDVIGRVSALAVDPSDSKHLLCGSAGGGIWESRDTGATWTPRTDAMPTLTTGAITFDPQNPQRVYAGSGEGNFYAALGAGIFVSDDGGTTWSILAQATFAGQGFYDLVIDPSNTKMLFAATTAGFFASINSGTTWKERRSGKCWDISLHPAGGSSGEIFAAFEDGLHRSTDRGVTWQSVSLPNALPSWARLAVDHHRANPDICYAFGADGEAGRLYRRSGGTWRRITLPTDVALNQAWYDWFLAAAPDKDGQVYIGAIDVHRGDLTGTTWKWTNLSSKAATGSDSIHPDQHAIAIDPNDANLIYVGNDGGMYRSPDRGIKWKALNTGLEISEIEYLALDPNINKLWLIAGTQDNGTLRHTGSTVWEHIADGDGGDCAVNPLNATIVYHSYYGMSLERSTQHGDFNSWNEISPGGEGLFYPPVEAFGNTVAMAGADINVTRNGTSPWTAVHTLPAGDLGSAMHVVDQDTIYVGTTNGRILRLKWSGAAWSKSNLTSPRNPAWVSDVTNDPSNVKRLWVTYQTIGGPCVFRSDDSGTTWLDKTPGLPALPINAVVVDPKDSARVWVAADLGVYQSTDEGASWSLFGIGLPNALAVDLLIQSKARVLVCGTRNRGAWSIPI